MLRLTDLTPRRRCRQLWSGRVRSTFALGRIPIFGRKCNSPEQGRWLGKFDSNFHFAGVLLPNERDGAGKLFGCLRVDDRHLLSAGHTIRHLNHAAISVHRDCMRLFLEILCSRRPADDYGHRNLDALSAPSFRTDFANARHRALYLSHSMISRVGERNAPKRSNCSARPPDYTKFYTAGIKLPFEMSRQAYQPSIPGRRCGSQNPAILYKIAGTCNASRFWGQPARLAHSV